MTFDHQRYSRASLHKKLDKLYDIAESAACDPRKWDVAPPPGFNPFAPSTRDNSSREALALAGEVVAPLIAWAINHKIGCLLGGLTAVPRAPRYHDDDQGSIEKRDAVNSPDREIEGADYDFSDNEINRELVAYVLEHVVTMRLGGRMSFVRELSEGLKALNFGEVRRVLEHSKTKLQGDAYTAHEQRIRAREHIAFRIGTGKSAEDAISDVGAAYGVEATEWWRRNRKSLSPLERKRIDYAKARGMIARDLLRDAKTPKERNEAKSFHSEYSDEVLRRDGRTYRLAIENTLRQGIRKRQKSPARRGARGRGP